MKRAAISAIAAVVLLVAGVASALVVGNHDHKIARSGSTGTTSTSTPTSTTVDIGTATEPSGPPVSIALDSAQQLLLVGNRIVALGQSPVAVPMGGPAADQPASTSGRSMPYPGPYRYEPQSRITVVDVSDPAAMRVTNRMDADGNYLSARLVGGVARVVLRSSPRGIECQPPRADTPEARAAALDP